MGQAGRTRGKLGRKRQATVDQGLRANAEFERQARAVRRGVVPGAEAEVCAVCKSPSEGWYVEAGKRTWYHFGRRFNCVERFTHTASAETTEAAGAAG